MDDNIIAAKKGGAIKVAQALITEYVQVTAEIEAIQAAIQSSADLPGTAAAVSILNEA